MKERPILFSATMVRAILEGRKTVTRRVVKAGIDLLACDPIPAWEAFWNCHPCPYGQPGDRLWVRETSGLQVRRDGCGGTGEFRVYRASRPDAVREITASGIATPIKWVPCIHMPRRASRITLEVTGVRVERLQDITPSQILAEGVRIPATPEGQALIDISTKHGPAHFLSTFASASSDDLLRAHWAALWVQINGIDSWHANPWVWAVEFKRVTREHAEATGAKGKDA